MDNVLYRFWIFRILVFILRDMFLMFDIVVRINLRFFKELGVCFKLFDLFCNNIKIF